MKISIPYGKDEVEILVNDENFGEMIYPNKVEIQDEFKILENALKNPIASQSFDDFLADARDVLFIVNDPTRPTPTAKILGMIYNQIKDKNIKFIIATGVHRAPTQEEYGEIFGDYYSEFKDRIHSHDAKKDDTVFLGTSGNGTEMLINRLGMEAHKIVIISSVEPHYFAGYTGGRKSFLPGIASYKTIEQNHKLALKPGAKALALKGNPVHEDMEEAINLIQDKGIFCILTVLDRNENMYAATAGDIHESFNAAISKAHKVFVVDIKEKADIVVTVAPYPMDIDLYQSQKAIDNAKLALNENGILILISKCRTGIGNDLFVKLLSESSGPDDALERIDRGYKLGYHKAAKMAEIARWAKMWAVTDLDPNILKSIFITPFNSIQEAIDAAVKEKGNAKILFMINGSLTVPRTTKGSEE